MGADAIPFLVVTGFWGVVFLIGCFSNRLFKKSENAGIISVSLIMTAVSCWLFWLCSYLAQMNPLTGPQIENTTLVIMGKEWGGEPSSNFDYKKH